MRTTHVHFVNEGKGVRFNARAAAFTGEGCKQNRFWVDLVTREIFVWDDVARSYTLCYALHPATRARLLKVADLLSEQY